MSGKRNDAIIEGRSPSNDWVKMKQNIFQDESTGTWSYIWKIITRDFRIEYEQIDGVATEEEAIEKQRTDQAAFDSEIRKLRDITKVRFTVAEYLNYWYTEILLPSTNKSTCVVTSWTLQSIIYPNMRNDVLLVFADAGYFNDLIENCRKYSKNAGEACSKTIRAALRDAYQYGFISKETLIKSTFSV